MCARSTITTVVFDLFILSLMASFSASTLLISCIISSIDLAINVVSSTKLRYDIVFLPIHLPLFQSSNILLIMYSPYTLKRSGDSLQPCLTIFSSQNSENTTSLTLTIEALCFYRLAIKLTRWEGTPIFVTMHRNLFHKMQSNNLL